MMNVGGLWRLLRFDRQAHLAWWWWWWWKRETRVSQNEAHREKSKERKGGLNQKKNGVVFSVIVDSKAFVVRLFSSGKVRSW